MKKQIHFVVLLCLLMVCCQFSFAQNDPCTATALAVGTPLASQTLTNSEDIADQTDCTIAPDPQNCLNGSAYGGWNQTQICEDIWYAVTVPASGSVIIQFANAGDITAAIYEGSCAGPLTQVTCDGDGDPTSSAPLVGAYGLAAGSTVYVRVWDFGCNTTQTFDISATAGTNTAGQDVSNATALTVGGAPLTNQNITDSNNLGDETYGVPEPSCNTGQFYDGTDICEDAWYQVTVPGTAGSAPVSLTVDAVWTAGTDHIMAIYKPSPAGSTGYSPLYEVACEDDGSLGTVSITVDCAVPGDVLYIRVWNYDCDGATTFDISVVQNAAPATPTTLNLDECADGNTYELAACGTDASPGLTLFDSGGSGGNYGQDEDYTVTVCVPAGSPAGTCLRAEFVSFVLEDGTVNTLSASNDYLYVYDGTSTGDPLVAGYTGNETANGRPGNIYSTNGCLTINIQTNGDEENTGFEVEFECVNCQNEITPVGGQTVTCGTPATFTDSGAAGGDYGNYEHNVWTYCPSDATQCIWADFSSFVTQEDVDYLYIYNGDNAYSDDLIGIYGGSGNLAGAVIKATQNSPGGCLTFKFVSSAGTTAAGWEASIDCGPCRLPTSSDGCSSATQLTQNGTYAGWNAGTTGDPACSDPNLNIPCFLSDNATSSPITELELTTWYEFTIPADVCLDDFSIALQNVACQDATGTVGLQFAIIEQPTGTTGCLWGNEWPDPILCYDQYVQGVAVDLNQAVIDQGGTGLVPGQTYYILTDAFNGSSCNWDLVVDNIEPPAITSVTALPADACSDMPITSLSVEATGDVEFVYDVNAIADPYALSGVAANTLGTTTNFDIDLGTASLESIAFPANTTCEVVTYNVCAIRNPLPTSVTTECRPSNCTTVAVYPLPPTPTFDVAQCGTAIVASDNCGTGSSTIEFEDPNNPGTWSTDPTTFTLADGDVLNWVAYAAGAPDNDSDNRPDCVSSGTTGTGLSNCAVVTCACPTCPAAPATTPVMTDLLECFPQYGDQAEMDGAADGTAANPFATWAGALAYAQANNIDYIQFAPGTYQTDNSVFNAFGLAGGWPVTLDGMYVDGQGATIIGNGTSVGFADVEADNVTFTNLNLTEFAQALEVQDVAAFTYCNGIIDGSDNNALNGVFVNSDAANTDATFINVAFNNHDTPNFTSAMDIFSSSTNAAINTTVNFCEATWSCNQRDGFGGALFIGHGGARGPDDPGPIVCMQGGGFYDNLGIGIASDGGALNVQDNSILNIDGTEFVCNTSNANDGTSGGGAIRVQGGADVDIQNANFSGNTTTQYGGAILFTNNDGTDPALTIGNTVFWDNTADSGGALAADGETTTNVTDSYFDGNQATAASGSDAHGGGAIYVDAGPEGSPTEASTVFVLSNSTLTGNTSATAEGGGMNVEITDNNQDSIDDGNSDDIQITNSVICNNTSTSADNDLTEDFYECFLCNPVNSAITFTTSIIGSGTGYSPAGNVPFAQGDCGNTAGVGYTTTAPAAIPCPASCPLAPTTADNCVACTPPDITANPTGAEICPGDGTVLPNSFDFATVTVTDASTYTNGEVVTITYHSATPADGTNVLPSTTVNPTTTTTYYILATNDNATPNDANDDCTNEIPFIVLVDDVAPMITCPADYTLGCGVPLPGPATSIEALNDSVNRICTGPIDITFGSDDGFFDIASTTDPIIEVEGVADAMMDFDIVDETATTGAGVLAGPGGASDIFFNFAILPTFDPYGGVAVPSTSVQYEVYQSTSGIAGQIVGASASTGDVRCYQVTVTLASHLKVEAQDFTALLNSVNTAGELYESASIVYLDANGMPFGSADYAGFYNDPVAGTAGNGTATLNSSTWNVAGTGVYVAQDQSVIDVTTDPLNPVATSNMPSDGFDPNANIDGGLPPTTPVSGVIYTVCLEDVAESDSDGGSTTSSTSFTSTLNGFSLDNICINSAACDNSALADLTLTSMDVSDGMTDPETITRTYTLTDACGNVATCEQTITIPLCGCTDCNNATCEHETMGESDWGDGLTVNETETFDNGADVDCEDLTTTAEDMVTICTEFVATGGETQVTVAAEGTGCTEGNLNVTYELTEDADSGTPCGTVNNGGYDPNTGTIDPPLQAGTTYQYCVTVDFSADAACDIDEVCPVILDCTTTPPNDDICDVDAANTWDLTIGTPLTNQNNLCATLENGEPTGGADQTVWYTYTVPPGVDAINVSTSNNDFNTIITIYTATLDCSNPPTSVDLSTQLDMPAVAQNDDAAGATAGESSATLCVEEGVTYYIQIDGNAPDEEGNFDIEVTDATGTTNCCTDCLNAGCEHETMGEQDWGDGLTVNETETFDNGADVDCEDFTGIVGDVVTVCTEFVATGNETQVTVAAEGTGCNAGTFTYEITEDAEGTGNPCGTVNNGGYDPNTGTIDPPLQAGTTYQYCVTVDFSADAACDIDEVCPVILDCDQTPVNDDICNAIDLSGTGTATNQDNLCATLENGETDGGNEQTVWYEYTVPPGVEGISIETSNNDFNTTLTTYTGTPNCAGGVDLSVDITTIPNGSNDDNPDGAPNGESYVEFCVEEGQTIYIQVDGNAPGEEGFFDITVNDETGNLDCCDQTPVNDDICDAIDLSGTGGATDQNNICATTETGETDGGAEATVWYTYTIPPGVESISVETSNNDFNTTLTTYTGTPNCAGGLDLSVDLTIIPNGNNDDAPGGSSSGESYVEFCVEEGETIYIQIDGNAPGEEGNFDISITDITGDINCSCNLEIEVIDITQGTSGGITPFYYNTATVEVINGTPPYDYHWATTGYVRHAVVSLGFIRIHYSDHAYWTVTITDANGCIVVATNDPAQNGGINEILDISSAIVEADICLTSDREGSITVNPEFGTPPYEYLWSGPFTWNNGNALTTTVGTITDLPTGWYTVTVIDSGDPSGPFDASGNPIVDGDPSTPLPQQTTVGWYWVQCLVPGRGKLNTEGITNLQIAPNPLSSNALIEMSVAKDSRVSLDLYTVDGRQVVTVFEGELKASLVNSIPFESGPLANGVYILQLTTQDGYRIHQKLLISK